MTSERSRWFTLAAGVLVVAVCGAAVRPVVRAEAAPVTLAPYLTLTGARSFVAEARCLRITTPESWAALWLEHLGEAPRHRYDAYVNKAGLPMVDFTRCMVIAVFDGETTNCAGFEALPPAAPPTASSVPPAGPATAVADWNDSVAPDAGDREGVLRILSHSYQTAGPDGGAVDATPFAFFVVPRTLAPIVIQNVMRPMGGGAERVVERARFPALPKVQRTAVAGTPASH